MSPNGGVHYKTSALITTKILNSLDCVLEHGSISLDGGMDQETSTTITYKLTQMPDRQVDMKMAMLVEAPAAVEDALASLLDHQDGVLQVTLIMANNLLAKPNFRHDVN